MSPIRWTTLILIMSLAAGSARAAYLYPWPASPSVVDPEDAALPAVQDILNCWHATDGAFHYFRMDLRGAPMNAQAQAAQIYGIYIDSIPLVGGGNGDVQYIPAPLAGIDYILDTHFDDQGILRHDYHTWSPYTKVFAYSTPDATQETENGGTTLEWKVAAGDIGPTFTWYGANLTQGQPSITNDITAPVVVPEPASVLLLMVPLLLLRRRG